MVDMCINHIRTHGVKQVISPTHSSTHFHIASGNVVIGNNNHNAQSSNAEKIIFSPTNSSTTAKKSNTYKKILKGVFISVIAGLIVMVIAWYFKLNAVRP